MSNLDTLVHLKEFSVRNNQLSSIPVGLEQRTKLTFLALSSNRFTQLPDFSRFPFLETLYVNGNSVDQIVGLGQLQHLKQVKVDLDMLPHDLAAKGATLLELYSDPSVLDIEYAQAVVEFAKARPIQRRSKKSD